jgi:cytochrome c oxidase subunit 3
MKNMATEIKIVEEAPKPLSMHPKKFAMWLFIVSVSMLFMAWTSAYIVKRGEPGWSSFDLPAIFWVNTGIVLLSSLSMYWAQRSARKDNLEMTKAGITATLILGTAFVVGQFLGWQKMTDMGYYFTGMGSNTSSSFIYVISGFHGLHLVGGLVYLVIIFVKTFRLKVHSKNMVSIEMCSTYWHFLGVLWLYLFVFLLLNR